MDIIVENHLRPISPYVLSVEAISKDTLRVETRSVSFIFVFLRGLTVCKILKNNFDSTGFESYIGSFIVMKEISL